MDVPALRVALRIARIAIAIAIAVVLAVAPSIAAAASKRSFAVVVTPARPALAWRADALSGADRRSRRRSAGAAGGTECSGPCS